MKKTFKKLLAIMLSVCVLLSTPVFTALAESYCPIESVWVTFHRPMYEETDGYWEWWDDPDDLYFHYDIEEYIRLAATINIEYDDGTIESLTLDEVKQREELEYSIGVYCEFPQYEDPWQAGDEIEAYFDLKHLPSDMWIYYDFDLSIEETPIESMTAVATKSLIENVSGDSDHNAELRYIYDPALTEPTFTIKWKDSSKADTTVSFADIEKTLYSPAPTFTSNQNSENRWSAGNTYTATAKLLGAECDFEVDVISLDVTGISATATHKAILGVDNYLSYDYENDEQYYHFNFDRFFPEITLTFENGQSITIEYNVFGSKTNCVYSLEPSSNQSSKTPWTEAGNYSFDINLSAYDDPDFEPLTCTMAVEVIKNPIAKIEAAATEPMNADNSWPETAYDEETGDYLGEYTYYSDIGSPEITVHYTDGTIEGPLWPYQLEELFDGKYSYSFYTNQSFENQWELGEHKVNLDFMGHTVEYDVFLTDRYVKSIKVVDAKVSDNNGYYNENNDFIYYTDFAVDLEFTLWDDSKVVKTVCEDEWCEYGFVEITTDQQTTPWVMGGENEFTVTLTDDFGAVSTATGNAEIVEYFEYDYYYSEEGIIITGYHGTLRGIVEIPEEIYDEPVVGIASLYPYDGNSELVEGIVIPDSVKTISDYAIAYFENLTSLKLGSGLTFIPEGLVCENLKLESIELSAENENYYGSQNAIFTKDKTELVLVAPAYTEMITLPAECTDINVLYEYALEYKNVKIGYETAGDYCVKENGITYDKAKTTVLLCDTDTAGEVVLPSTVTNIASHAFENCDKITSVTIQGSVTNLAYAAFADCTSLTSVTLPSSLEGIGEYAFAGCTNLSNVNLPNKLESIDTSAFRYTALKNITIPDSVSYLGYYAFANSKLETVKLGSGLKSMQSSFFKCESLKSVNVPAGIEDFDGAFAGCTALSSVTLENGLEFISGGAFSGCSSLTEIKIPSTVIDIWEAAFSASGLKSVTIPNSVMYISEKAFSGCSDLVTVNMGSGVEYIGLGAFAYTGVKNINWGSNSNVDMIDSLAFASAELESVEIPNTVTAIMYAAFESNKNLSSIKIPSSVNSVGSHAFDETAWYMAQNKGVTYIDNILYRYKGDVTEPTVINIKNGTRLIADAAFQHMDPEDDDPEWFLPDSYYDLSGITEINIPNSVTSIGNIAFIGLPGLTEITLPDGLETLGSFPFAYCENLTTLNIGKATPDFYSVNFAGCYSIEEVTADPQNSKYTVLDGVLYNKNMTELIYCPPAKTGDLVVPASVQHVRTYAFSYTSLTSITFTNPDVDIEYQAFDDYYWYYNEINSVYEVYSWNLPENDVILKAPADSSVEYYADRRNLDFETIEVVEEKQSGITVSESVENAIPEGASLVVEPIEPDEENTVVFDITLECDGEAVQPDAPVTVKIPLPEGIDPQLCKVYRLETDGSKTDMKATVVNGNIYFTTDHFSLYVIESSFLPGDIDGSGEVDLQDVVALSQIVAEWEDVECITAALDPDGNGEVNLQDVVVLAQFVARWEVTLSDVPYSAE